MHKTYKEFEDKNRLSPLSPEAHYAESAWNCALKEASRLVNVCAKTGITVEGLVATLQDELSAITTDYND
jgi:hypothetical protein